VPEQPLSVSLSASELHRVTFVPGQRPDLSGLTLTVKWPNPEGDLHFITYQNIEPDPEPVEETGFFFRAGRFISEPIPGDSMLITSIALTHYGAHEVRVYRVTVDYARLYGSRQQDTRDLNEPASNIHNGLGIFSGFASRSTTFTLVKD
jgi:hypothetical protein